LALAVVDGVDALAPQAAEGGVTFRLSAPPVGEAVIRGDRDQILQVIQNLAENALKYSPCMGEVSVEVVTGLTAAAAGSPGNAHTLHLSLLTPDHTLGQ